MRVFLDIGSHTGETVAEVEKAKYGFERIVCFEPASVCQPPLQELARKDSRIEVAPFGLGAKSEKLELSNPGWAGASIVGGAGPTETVEIVDVADWLRANIDPTDFLVVKTNCEGAEVDIVNRVLDAGLANWPVIFMVTFDIRNFPEHRHKEVALRRRLRGQRNFCFADNVMIGTTHEKRIAHWLHLFGIDRGLDRRGVEREFASAFSKYSRMTGRRQRVEMRIKERLNYAALPEPIKAALRHAKKKAGLSRERDLPNA